MPTQDNENASEESFVKQQSWRARFNAWPRWRKVLFWALPILAVLFLLVDLAVDRGWMDGWTSFNLESRITALVQDRDGRIWVGTLDDGLYTYDGQNWMHYKPSDYGLPGNYIQALAVDPSGRLWLAAADHSTEPGSIAILDNGVWKTYPHPNLVFNNARVNSIAFDKDGHAWIGYGQELSYFEGGIRIFDGQSWMTYTSDNSGLPDEDVQAIAFDDSGLAWIGTSHGGLTVFDGNTWKVFGKNEGFYDVLAITFDNKSRVLAGTGDGLIRFDGKSWTKLADDYIEALQTDQSGHIFAVTLWGNLLFFNGISMVRITTHNSPLCDLSQIQLSYDHEVQLWMGCDDTLMMVSPTILQPKPEILVSVHNFINPNSKWISYSLTLLWIAVILGILPYVIIGLVPGFISLIFNPEIKNPCVKENNIYMFLLPFIFGSLGGLLSGLASKCTSPRRTGRVIAIIILILGLLFGCASSFYIFMTCLEVL